jgi:hypothetical protein
MTPPNPFADRPRLRPAGRLVNRVGGWLRRLGFPVADLSEEELLRAARRRTGLDDFGDNHFRAPLRALADAYQTDPGLTFIGRAIARQILIHLLSNRLRVARDLRQYPDITAGPVRRPLFVVGFPRTGTTLLQNLLSQDLAARPLLFWESMAPSPPPEPATRDTDPRIRTAERVVERLYHAVPEMPTIHALNPRGPDECLGLLFNTFVTPFFRGKIPGYRAWLGAATDADVTASYQDYRRQLQLLQWRCPGGHWVLKCPSHLFGLGALLAVFPDAAVVQTHRDPAEAVASLCSLSAALDALSYETVDRQGVGRRTLAIVEQLLARGLKARQAGSAGRFFDLHYQDLLADPVGSVGRIHEHFGYDYTPAPEAKLQAYLAANRQHRHGVHRYRLEDFGLDRDDLRARFAGYCERFGVKQAETPPGADR